jgi:hypothetical protein
MLKIQLKILLLTLSVATIVFTGCAVDEETLSTWARVPGGHKKISSYLSDSKRPEVLRVHAARVLLDAGRITELIYVLNNVSPRDRKRLVQALANIVVQYIDKHEDPVKMRGASLAYYLFQFSTDLTGLNYNEPRDKLLVDRVVGWLLERLKIYDSLPKGTQTPEEILLAAAHTYPNFALPHIYAYLKSPPDLKRFLIVNRVLTRIQTEPVKKMQAKLLLEYARKSYPKVDPVLALAMLQNENETLLRFLLDAVRDYRVPSNTRIIGLKTAELLKEKALPGLMRVLKTDDPKNDNLNRLNALDLIWNIGGAGQLKKSLEALPATGTWWPIGVEFKAQVDEFCDVKLKPAAAEVRSILTGLIDDANWVTRVYAMECMVQIYDDAAAILEPLQTDDTVLKGWSIDGDITIGEYVKSLSDEQE